MWTSERMINAIHNGDLQEVIRCRENGVSWEPDMTLVAAIDGHLEIFQWLIQRGCPRDGDKIITLGDATVVQWFRTR